nr:hypothetical protein [Rhodococcus sp. (in: high G+C Gram-positive bacteria)]
MKSGDDSLFRTLLSMRVTLYKRRFRGGRAVVNTVFGALGLVYGITLCARAASGEGNPGIMAMSLVGIGIAWLIGPVLSGISDDNLHPRQFTLLPIDPRRLARGLLFSSAIGMTVPVTAVAVAVLPVHAAAQSLAAVPIALVAWPATVVLVVAAARVAALTMAFCTAVAGVSLLC